MVESCRALHNWSVVNVQVQICVVSYLAVSLYGVQICAVIWVLNVSGFTILDK